MAEPLRLNPAFAAACSRLHDAIAEAYRRALYVQARTVADIFAGRAPREPAAYPIDAGIDVEAERARLR